MRDPDGSAGLFELLIDPSPEAFQRFAEDYYGTWYDERGGGEPLVLLHGGWIFTPTAGGEMPEWVVAAYAEVSPDGRDHFPVVAAKIVEAAVADPLSLTEPELAGMAARKLVMASDDDIVHLEHTLALYGRSTVPN